MVPGKMYGAYALAAKFHVRTAKMRPVLEKMITLGMLEISKAQPGTLGFRRAKEIAQPVSQEQIETTVATQQVLVRLDGVLGERELLPAYRHLTDAEGKGRFVVSGADKFDSAPRETSAARFSRCPSVVR